MYRIENILIWFIWVFIVVCLFYGMMLFLPVFLLIVGGYVLYQLIKVWLWRRAIMKNIYVSSVEEEGESPKNGKIIDAEFEILDEK